jgi:NAD(P)-dependent dehydrogenase (short-subunit alcohol dehydrogenase family)
VLRSGRLAESGFNRDWPAARVERYREIVRTQGYYANSGWITGQTWCVDGGTVLKI